MIFGETLELDDRRPCLVDGDQAYFHRWAEQDSISYCASGTKYEDFKIVRGIYALIEYIDGTVELVRPERVRFTDN